jgi:hypothetical protein
VRETGSRRAIWASWSEIAQAILSSHQVDAGLTNVLAVCRLRMSRNKETSWLTVTPGYLGEAGGLHQLGLKISSKKINTPGRANATDDVDPLIAKNQTELAHALALKRNAL